jgi:gas vesicle protein
MSQYEPKGRVEGDPATGERTPSEIESEIERTRERMSENLDALGERLRPDSLKRQAKDAIAEKAQHVVANVGDQARETGSRVIDFITANQLPVAAVSLGAIWLFSLRRGRRREVSGDRVGELGATARRRARRAKGGLQRAIDENPLALAAGAVIVGLALGTLLPETESERRLMGETRDELTDRVSDAASRVKEVAAESGRDLQETVREEMDQRGPEIKRTLGDAAEDVKERGKSSAERVAKEAKEAVRRPSSGRKA